jgi:predicted O-methyltransferase YrrM
MGAQVIPPGSLIVVDNVVRRGAVIDAANPAPGVQGTRRMFDLLSKEPRLSATQFRPLAARGMTVS